MAQSIVERRAVFEAVLTAVKAATNVPPMTIQVYDGAVPSTLDLESDPNSSLFPYVLAYDIGSQAPVGPSLTAPEADAGQIIQFTSVGRTRAQAQWCSDLVRRIMLARSADGSFQVVFTAPTGWRLIDRASYGGAAGVTPEGAPPHEVFSVPDTFVVYATPDQ